MYLMALSPAVSAIIAIMSALVGSISDTAAEPTAKRNFWNPVVSMCDDEKSSSNLVLPRSFTIARNLLGAILTLPHV
jgi:hypothetical protein